jgi:hypothetical protein
VQIDFGSGGMALKRFFYFGQQIMTTQVESNRLIELV